MNGDDTLNEKIVVVTGAAGRLGQQVVQWFAGRGATIVALVRDEQEARSIPFPEDAEGWAFPVDATNESMVTACFDQIRQQFGHVDVLIHAVGGWEQRPFFETTMEQWERVMRLNLGSAFLCFREAAQLMDGRGGRLIGIASGQGADRGAAQQGAYSAAKAGLIRLVEATAAELKGTGITAHAIAPSTLIFDGDEATRGVPAAEIVRLCHYLCGPAGNALNGTTLRAYGNGA